MDKSIVHLLKWKIKKDGYLKIKINGSCMEPFITDSEIILVENINNYNDLKSGDIILVYSDNHLRAHRIVSMKKTQIYTKGDNALAFDENIDYKNIIGVIKLDGYNGLNKEILKYFFTKLSYIEGYFFSLHCKNKFPLVKWKTLVKITKKIKAMVLFLLKN